MLEAYFALSGRVRRWRYFLYSCLLWIIVLLLILLAIPLIDNARYPLAASLAVLILIGLFWIWADAALTVKRLHDLDGPGTHYLWMVLLPALLGGGGTLSFAVRSVVVNLNWSGGILSPLAALWILLAHLYLVFARGTDGPNRFGYPPEAR